MGVRWLKSLINLQILNLIFFKILNEMLISEATVEQYEVGNSQLSPSSLLRNATDMDCLAWHFLKCVPQSHVIFCEKISRG